MTQQEKTMKKYTNAVERRLRLPLDIRARVMTDFQTTIAALRERGLTDQEVFAQLGTPKQAAAELNEQMKAFVWQKSPWRFLFLAGILLSGAMLAFSAGMHLLAASLARNAASIGIIGGADGPTAVFVTQRVGINWELVLLLAVLTVSAFGYWRLCRCKGKDREI